MLFQALALFAAAAVASAASLPVSEDGRQVVTHYEEENWCEVIDWDTKCEQFIPAAWTGGASKVLKSSCTAGDKDGNNKSTQSTVFCSASNSDVASDSWVTGFVVSMAGANPLAGGAPTDTFDCGNTGTFHDGRLVTSHHADEDWCTSNHWHDYCDEMKPTGSNVLLSSCQPGDKSGRDKETKSTVFCSVGNLDIPGQQTWITGFVITMAGSLTTDGSDPKDTTHCPA
ncbi:hypothetical protein BDV98DRAFT_567776 [Pterulicium gracile]|uniref:Uncharacterized protein n=1 Tax=Pterulicium gracile TaxID=1884261 RepID=A0A5C3QJB3_9AGAR|nr:hypothetical protein BDV98DRAFT_567776 [Pterula gracilis]